jgi:hypothetical protein
MPFTKQIPCRSIFAVFRDKNISVIYNIARNSVLVKEKVSFSLTKKTAVINVLLPANKWAQSFKTAFLPRKKR